MKKVYLISFLFFFVLKANTALCTKHTISATNAQFAFTPSDVSAYVGDTIVFSLVSIHSALEVSQATYDANGNTGNGGFHVSFGGGQTVVTTAKTYYYVCENHYFMGMKGTINVTDPTGVNDLTYKTGGIEIFPNPVSSIATIKAEIPGGKESQIKIFDVTGKCVYGRENIANVQSIDLSGFSQGIYLVALKYGDVYQEKKIIVSR